jgi:hypothetical protein
MELIYVITQWQYITVIGVNTSLLPVLYMLLLVLLYTIPGVNMLLLYIYIYTILLMLLPASIHNITSIASAICTITGVNTVNMHLLLI